MERLANICAVLVALMSMVLLYMNYTGAPTWALNVAICVAFALAVPSIAQVFRRLYRIVRYPEQLR